MSASLDERLGLLLSDSAALIGRSATDLSLDGIERGDACQRIGDDLIEGPSHMAPAERQFDPAGFLERAIAGIAVDLQDAPEALEMGGRALGLAVRRVDIGDCRRRRSAPRPIVARVCPELAGLGAPSVGSTGAVVSSANSLGEARSSSSSLACNGCSHQAPRPTQSASVEGSRPIPWRA